MSLSDPVRNGVVLEMRPEEKQQSQGGSRLLMSVAAPACFLYTQFRPKGDPTCTGALRGEVLLSGLASFAHLQIVHHPPHVALVGQHSHHYTIYSRRKICIRQPLIDHLAAAAAAAPDDSPSDHHARQHLDYSSHPTSNQPRHDRNAALVHTVHIHVLTTPYTYRPIRPTHSA